MKSFKFFKLNCVFVTFHCSKFFTVSKEDLAYEVAHLVFEGVDTVAFVELNDSPIGTTNNMFVKYTFDVKPHLKVRAY